MGLEDRSILRRLTPLALGVVSADTSTLEGEDLLLSLHESVDPVSLIIIPLSSSLWTHPLALAQIGYPPGHGLARVRNLSVRLVTLTTFAFISHH